MLSLSPSFLGGEPHTCDHNHNHNHPLLLLHICFDHHQTSLSFIEMASLSVVKSKVEAQSDPKTSFSLFYHHRQHHHHHDQKTRANIACWQYSKSKSPSCISISIPINTTIILIINTTNTTFIISNSIIIGDCLKLLGGLFVVHQSTIGIEL